MSEAVATQDSVFDHEALQAFSRDILVNAGLSADDASFVAATLVQSSLRGVDTHGIQLLPNLASRIFDRTIDPAVRARLVHETPTTAVLDGQNGVGQVVTRQACDIAVRMAKRGGVGFVTIRNSNHFGAGATWAQEIAGADLIGIVGCNSFPLMAPWGGREARLGTNPLAVAVPCGERGPWALDMATSTVPMNKLLVAHRNGEQQIPSGWALDANGAPTTDVRAAVKGGTLLPVGGSKGAGLAMLIDILSGVLSGGMFGADVAAFNVAGVPTRTSAFVGAINIGAFMPIDEFKTRLDFFIEMMCSTSPAEGFQSVMMPGQPEAATEALRRREGVPISASLLSALQATAAKLNTKPLMAA